MIMWCLMPFQHDFFSYIQMASSPIHASSLSHLFRRVNQEFSFEESILEIYFGHDYSVCNLQQTTPIDLLHRY